MKNAKLKIQNDCQRTVAVIHFAFLIFNF